MNHTRKRRSDLSASRLLGSIVAIASVAVLLVLQGCTFFGVNRNWAREGIELGAEDRAKSNRLSRESLEVLYRENLLELYSQDPKKAFEVLVANILRDPVKQKDPARIFAAAEFANVLAERDAPPWNRRPFIKPRGHEAVHVTDQTKIMDFLENRKEILLYYGMASYLSFSYLTLVSEHLDAEAFKPQFRSACEIYNYSLEQSIRFHLDAAPFNPQSFYRLENGDQAVKTRFELVGFDWGREDFHEILMAEDFASDELGPTSQWKGLGVPLIGLRYRSPEEPDTYFPEVLAFPITALHIPQVGFDLEATESRDVIYLVNPWNKNSVQVGNLEIPIEADLSTPLDYTLNRTGFNSNQWKGFTGKDAAFKAKVFLIQPHRPGRIPIILCHGLLSSPGPWETLVNGLLDDPWIRERYEFWFVHYPTGKGLLLNAYDVKEALETTRRELDPAGTDAALDQMVFIGHSM
ncbi:MAG: hypothetical protein KC931_22670, partial [Candidatus Omnitrophica bacterium]|nr:hypothetical protein [Candidatus Omnitrophota bacterium]